MTKRKTVEVIPFEFLSEKKAMERTPYQTTALFRQHFGDLYHAPAPGRAGGYLATELQARIEDWPIESRNPKGRAS